MRLPVDLHRVSRVPARFVGQVLADQYIGSVVVRPVATHLPPWMSDAYAGRELFLAERQPLGKISSQDWHTANGAQIRIDRKHWRESYDVVVPERAANLREIGLVKIRAVARRPKVDATDLEVQGVLLGSHDEVRAVGSQFPVDLVSDVRRDSDHGSGDTNSH